MENSKTIQGIIVVQNILNLLLPICFFMVFIIGKNQSPWIVGLFCLYILASFLFTFKYRMAALSTRNKTILWIFIIIGLVIGLVAIFFVAK
jgi:hypothetical protein